MHELLQLYLQMAFDPLASLHSRQAFDRLLLVDESREEEQKSEEDDNGG
jgi:hypothetical protein